MKFNPNKCADNPAVKRVLRFLLNSVGFELTRFEWEQRRECDLDFTFDQFSRMDLSGIDGAGRCLQYVKKYGLTGIRVFTDAQRYDIENGELSPAAV